jgi:pilus assembly protein CpaC
MKKLLSHIFILAIIQPVFAKLNIESSTKTPQTIIIELGEDYPVPRVQQKIWIENSPILKAESSSRGLLLKPQSLGRCKVKIDGQMKIIYVVPAGYKASFETWHKLSYKFPNITVGFCENTICLKGQILDLSEFKKIIQAMRDQSAYINLGLSVQKKTQSEIESWYANYFRENSITPLKIIFNPIWKVFLTTKDDFQTQKEILQKVGLVVVENKQKIDIGDNVRVKIQITEVKKELTRSLGIKWPESYNTQVLNFEAQGLQPFDLQVRAYEKSGDMKILASPNLICRTGKSAEFFAGGEFPIVTRDSKSYQTVIWKKYGISLKIKPIIDSIGQMSIELETEISSIDKSREINGIPAMHEHKVMSHFDLIQSKTIALSGLIKNETGTANEGLPYLKDIPLLGKLFASEEFLENRTELVIFVTPELME